MEPCKVCSEEKGLPVYHPRECLRERKKYPPRPRRRCRVCGRSEGLFQRFPSCRRKAHGSFEEENFFYEPVEGHPIRIHVDYCSAFCYTHTTRGHWARIARGRRRRKRRMRQRWMRGLSPNPRGRQSP